MAFTRRRPLLRAAAIVGARQRVARRPRALSGGLGPEAMDQLKSLAQLHDQGILTDDEFDQQKIRVLGG